MATYFEYCKAQDTVNSFRREALENVKSYIRSGQSSLGKVNVHDYLDGTPDNYAIEFGMEIRVRENGNVLVFATPENGETVPLQVPVSALGELF